MNIFLDKSLPKRTQIILKIVRIILLICVFGEIFYASINPAATDILIYTGIAAAIIFFIMRIIVERKKRRSSSKEYAE